jgi:hypothetical protein
MTLLPYDSNLESNAFIFFALAFLFLLLYTMPIKSVADIWLTTVSDAAWAMAARAREKDDNNDKLEADALRLAKDTVKEITDIVTDNKPFIDAAYEAAYKRDNEEQQRWRQMNNSKESQEEDYKRKQPIV